MTTRIRLAGVLALLLMVVSAHSANAQQHANNNRGSRLVVPPHAGNAHANAMRNNMGQTGAGAMQHASQGNVAMQQMRQQMQANHQAMMMQQQEVLASQMSRHNRIQKQHQIQAARLAHSSVGSNATKSGTSTAASNQTVSKASATTTATTAGASTSTPAANTTTNAISATASTGTNTTTAATTATGTSAKAATSTTNPLTTKVTPTTNVGSTASTPATSTTNPLTTKVTPTTSVGSTPTTTTTGTTATTTPGTTPAVAASTTTTPAVGSTSLATTGLNRGVNAGSRSGLAGLYGANFGQSPNVQGAQSLVLQLHNAYSTLAGADHDYQGHRVRAMNHIQGALRHLGMSSSGMNGVGMRQNNGAGLAGAGANGTGNGGGAARLPQAQSDTALRQAVGYLRNAQMQVYNGGLGGAGNMAMTGPASIHGGGMITQRGTQRITQNVHMSIVAAVRELEVALSIR